MSDPCILYLQKTTEDSTMAKWVNTYNIKGGFRGSEEFSWLKKSKKKPNDLGLSRMHKN